MGTGACCNGERTFESCHPDEIMGVYTVIGSGPDCRSGAYSSGGSSPSAPTKCRFSAYIGNCNATVISVLMVSYHNKLEIKDTMVYIIGMEVRFLRRHKYGDCSSVGRVEDCGSFGHGFDPHHSPKIKYAVVAQLVEHMPEEHGVGCSIHSHRTNVQMAKLDQRISLQN